MSRNKGPVKEIEFSEILKPAFQTRGEDRCPSATPSLNPFIPVQIPGQDAPSQAFSVDIERWGEALTNSPGPRDLNGTDRAEHWRLRTGQVTQYVQ